MASYISQHVPRIYENNKTMAAIIDTQEEELDLTHSEMKRAYLNNFVSTADAEGLSQFEKLLGIDYHSTQTLESRRAVILSIMTYMPPHTKFSLRQWLESLFGKGNFSFKMDVPNHVLMIDIPDVDPIAYREMMARLPDLIPATVSLVVAADVPFTWGYLLRHMTWGGKANSYTEHGEETYAGQGDKTYADFVSELDNAVSSYTWGELLEGNLKYG